MDEVLAVLLGAGAWALSPLLSPKLRPVAKSAVKSGMLVTAVATAVASATGETVQDAVSKVREEINAVKEPDGGATSASTAEATTAETAETGETQSAADGGNTATATATAPLVQSLRPIVNSAVKGGHVMAGIAVGVANKASEQWNGLVAEAQAERANKVAPSDAASDVMGGPVPTPAAGANATTADSSTRGMFGANTKETTDVAASMDPVPDNLRLIKGIGPKTAKHLNESGILTFEQLAVVDQTRLHEILGKSSAYYRNVDTSSWSLQARHLSRAREK